jgi:hypothetical protein
MSSYLPGAYYEFEMMAGIPNIIDSTSTYNAYPLLACASAESVAGVADVQLSMAISFINPPNNIRLQFSRANPNSQRIIWISYTVVLFTLEKIMSNQVPYTIFNFNTYSHNDGNLSLLDTMETDFGIDAYYRTSGQGFDDYCLMGIQELRIGG